jgi:acyl-CoA dehydrogenase
MNFDYSPKVRELQSRVTRFMEEHVYPSEARFESEMKAFRAAGNAWQPAPVMEELKAKEGTGGVRKLRWGRGAKGKSG